MTHQGRRSLKIAAICTLLTLLLTCGLLLSIQAGLVDISGASPRQIQDQGSSPYCLFAVNAYLAGQDMWQLEAEYWRRDFPDPPTNAAIFPLLNKQMTWPKQWRYELAAAQLQHQPVAASGHGHAIVLLNWKDGIITYLDPLHPEKMQVMRDREFWQWSNGWYWWTVEATQ